MATQEDDICEVCSRAELNLPVCRACSQHYCEDDCGSEGRCNLCWADEGDDL